MDFFGVFIDARLPEFQFCMHLLSQNLLKVRICDRKSVADIVGCCFKPEFLPFWLFDLKITFGFPLARPGDLHWWAHLVTKNRSNGPYRETLHLRACER